MSYLSSQLRNVNIRVFFIQKTPPLPPIRLNGRFAMGLTIDQDLNPHQDHPSDRYRTFGPGS